MQLTLEVLRLKGWVSSPHHAGIFMKEWTSHGPLFHVLSASFLDKRNLMRMLVWMDVTELDVHGEMTLLCSK